jgi:hypothetical protein
LVAAGLESVGEISSRVRGVGIDAKNTGTARGRRGQDRVCRARIDGPRGRGTE